MRCPKCGYISFDYQETCKKCKNSIVDAVTEINGTVCDSLPPSFLQFETKDGFGTQPSSLKMTEENELVVASGTDVAVQEVVDIDLFQGAEEIDFGSDSEKSVIDLDDFSEVSPQEEYTLDLDKGRGGFNKNLPSLDFGDLDISDLAPPDKEGGDNTLFEEKLELDSAEPVAALSIDSIPQQKISSTKSTGLEDLHVNGLNLDSSAKFVPGSATGKRHLPLVKTGTALDKFDIDLGELFEQNKK